MAEFLPPAVQKFIADTREYNDPINESARLTSKFGRSAEEASIVAKKALNNAREAADKLAVAQREAANAADRLRKGEIDEAAAAELAAKATHAKERADIAARESAIAASKATDKQADNYRQLARDAAMAAAVEHAANVRASGDAEQHARAVAEVKKAFPELEKSASSAFRAIEKEGPTAFKAVAKNGVEEMGMLQKVGIAGVAEAIANLPFIAGVAGGAITFVMGGVMSAIAMKVQASNKDVKTSFANLRSDVGRELRVMTEPFHKVMLEIPAEAELALKSISPALTQMFSEMGPAVSRFIHSLSGAMSGLSPMLESLGTAFSNLLDDMGGRMGPIINNIATGFKAIFDAVSQNPQAIGQLIESFSYLVRGLGDAIGFLIKFKDQINTVKTMMLGWSPSIKQVFEALNFLKTGFQELNPFAKDTNSTLQIAGGTFNAFAGSGDTAAQSLAKVRAKTQDLVTEANTAKLSVDQLKQAFDRLTGANQSAATAEINMQQAIHDTTAAIKANGQSLDLTTQKGRDNYKQLIATAQAFQDNVVAMKNDGASASQVQTRMSQLRSEFISLAYQMTGNRKEAIALADRLLGIASASNKIPRVIRQDIYQVMHLTPTQAYLNQRKNILGYAQGGLVKGYAGGGQVQGYPTGGQVFGAGTGTSDSIPAKLSNGEFVVNAKATRKNLQLLNAINTNTKGFGGVHNTHPPLKWIEHHASTPFTAHKRSEWINSSHAEQMLRAYRYSGQSAWMMRGGAGSGPGVTAQHVTNVNVHVYGTVVSQRELDDRIQELILQRNIRNPTSGVSLPSGRVG